MGVSNLALEVGWTERSTALALEERRPAVEPSRVVARKRTARQGWIVRSELVVKERFNPQLIEQLIERSAY